MICTITEEICLLKTCYEHTLKTQNKTNKFLNIDKTKKKNFFFLIYYTIIYDIFVFVGNSPVSIKF